MTNHKLCQFIVNSFVQSPNWAKEIKIAKKLISEEYNEDFWLSIPKERKFTSLAFFLAEEGQKTLRKYKNISKLDFPEKKEIILFEEECSKEPKQFQPTVKTLLEFLKK